MDAAQIRLKHLRQMAASMSAARLTEINLQGSGWTVRMRFNPSAATPPDARIAANNAIAPQPPVSPPAESGVTVTSPLPGRFLNCYPGYGEPYVRPGVMVNAGDLLGLVQSGMMLLPLRSPVDGKVQEMMAGGENVEYDTPVAVVLNAGQVNDDAPV